MIRNLKYKRQRSNLAVVDCFPKSVVDQCCLTIKQQIDRFKITGEIPSAGDYQYSENAESRLPIDNYMTDPVDIAEKTEHLNNIIADLLKENVDTKVDTEETANTSTNVEEKADEKAE